MFYYSYFDFVLESNIKLTNFNSISIPKDSKQDINKIKINYTYGSPRTYQKNSNDAYVCYEDVVFHIPKNEQTINIICENLTAFQEVIRNKPFGVLSFLMNRIVLHASSIEYDGKIYAFCGPKGMGKTTLSFLLSKKYPLFSDDQLCVKLSSEDTLYCCSPDNIQKLTSSTLSFFGLNKNDDSLHPVYRKYMYQSPNYSLMKICKLKAIFILRRESVDAEIRIEKIQDYSHKVAQIINHTLGKNQLLTMGYLNSAIVDCLAKIDMYYLHYPSFSNDVNMDLTKFEKAFGFRGGKDERN